MRTKLSIALILLVAGCSKNALKNDQDFACFENIPDSCERYDPAPKMPTNFEGVPPICLALSGGGIRSAAVSLGVLQELHRRELLSKISFVSSVSGGGYPVAGILRLMTKNAYASVDSVLGSESAYLQGDALKSNFISKPKMLSNIALGALFSLTELFNLGSPEFDDLHYSASHIAYESDIGNAFASTKFEPFFSWPKLAVVPTIKGFPYPIFLASANANSKYPARSGHRYDGKDIFELTPQWIGSERTGYWANFTNDLTLGNAIAISAAAVDTPGDIEDGEPVSQQMKRLGFRLGAAIPTADKKDWVYVADGGFIDNLAVIPLLRRGCKKIVALDASFDPTGEFKAWDSLSKIVAREYGVMEPLTNPLTNAVPGKKGGWALEDHIWSSKVVYPDRTSEIIAMKLGLATGNSGIYEGLLSKYNQHDGAGDLCSYPNLPKGLRYYIKTDCPFPLQTTGKQQYDSVEFSEYRAMGRHLVVQLLNELKNSGEPLDAF